MHRSNRPRQIEQSGFALVLSLIIIAVAAVIVVGFLGSAGHDRLTAETGGERYRAELAAASGLEGAKKALTALSSGISKSANDYFIVTSSNDINNVPYYFIGTADGGSVSAPTIQYYPLYSGGPMPSPSPSPFPIPVPTFTGIQAQQTIGAKTFKYPLLFSTAPHSTWQPNMHTSWQIVDNTIPATAEHARFTYWIEDLAGYVDANVAGNVDDISSTPNFHARPAGVLPKELALFTLFAPTAQFDSGATYAKTLVGNHSLLFTPLTTRVGGTAGSPDDLACLASLVGNPSIDSEQNVIPYGLGFPSPTPGQSPPLKTNINQVISDIKAVPPKITRDAGVTKISSAISTNLPSFASSRKGTLNASQDYLKTIAANIIDYAGVNSIPTVGTGYRGIGLYPFVVEYCDEFQWTNGADTYQVGTEWYADMTVTTFVQVWNMFGSDITSGQLRFVDVNKSGVNIQHNGNKNVYGNLTSFDRVNGPLSTPPRPYMEGTLDFGPTPSPSPVIAAGTLHANEYKVYQIAQRTYVLDCGTTQPGPANSVKFRVGLYGNKNTLTQPDTASSYQVYWNGVLVDQPPNGITRTNFEFSRKDLTPDFHSTMPALRYSSGNAAPFLLGDPRGNYYIQASQVDVYPYSNTSWWGRVLMNGAAYYANEARTVYWPDGGHNTTATGPAPTPSPAASPTPVPTNAGPPAPWESTKAPARISNSGQFSSITELGYIYDPFQQDPFTSAPTSATGVNNTWSNAWTNGFNSGSANKAMYGSHSTLRIGRPEFKTFDNNNGRASQLLDILSITDRVSTQGKININTASKEVLRTLGAGIKLANDGAIQPSAVYGPKTTTEADLFATYVAAARNTSPFISTSGLATLKTTTGKPFFGNPAVWTSGGPTEWNDAASEEYFAKIFNFTTVRSRNFRVFVTGQVYVPANGSQPERVIATANKVYQVFLKPTRDSTTGAITSQNCQVTYSADVF